MFRSSRLPGIVVGAPEWIVALLASPLFFLRLGHGLLWTDEAQTALLGFSVLERGLPYTVGSLGTASAGCGLDAGLAGLHMVHPWGQAYIAAVGLALVGFDTLGARLPFTLAGWLCVPLAGRVAGLGGGRVLERVVAATLTATSVFFLLHVRQARYYAPAALLVLLVIAAFLRADAGRGRRPALAIGVPLAALVLVFDPAAMALIGGLVLHLAGRRLRGAEVAASLRPTLIGLSAGVLALLFWAVFGILAGGRPGVVVGARTVLMPLYYGVQLNAHVIPFLVVVPLALIVARRRHDPAFNRRLDTLILIAAIVLVAVAALSFAPLNFPRYVVPLVPLIFAGLALGIGMAVSPTARRLQAAAITLLLIVGPAHVLSNAIVRQAALAVGADRLTKLHPAEPWKPYLVSYLEELRQPPSGPLTAVVEYLDANAAPGDSIVTTYGVPSLGFHTPLRAFGGLTCAAPPAGTLPEWLWLRRPWTGGFAARAVEQIEAALAAGEYEAIELDAPDRPWENREDIHAHTFRDDRDDRDQWPPVLLYRRVGAPGS